MPEREGGLSAILGKENLSKGDAATGVFVAIAAVALLSPLTAVSSLTGYLAHKRYRVRPGVIAQGALIFTLLMNITGLVQYSLSNYAGSLGSLFSAIQSEEGLQFSDVLSAFLVQAPFSLVLGAWLSVGYSIWSHRRHVAWEDEPDYRITPLQWFRKRRTVKAIQEDQGTPRDGATLGVSREGERIIQTEKEAAAHTLVFGASGSGKTTTALTLARDHIKNQHGYIFIDLKGGSDVPEALAEYARRYGRRFQHFTFHDPKDRYRGPAEDGPAFYDPLARGDASRRKDMVISGRKWSEEYYKILASAYLQTAFEVMIACPPKEKVDALTDIVDLLRPATLAERARNLPDDPYYEDVRAEVHKIASQKMDRNEASVIEGLHRELQVIRGSTAGRWMRLHPDPERNIDLYRAAERGDVIVFSLDALTYPETAKLLANLIISDLKTVTGDLIADPVREPLHVFIDEFSALDSEGITGLINKSRSAGMPITLATQALGDLRRIDPSFLDQLLGIVNSFIIHRANTLSDAEVLAGITGKDRKWDVRISVEEGRGTGKGMMDKVEEYIIPPNVIQNLRAGEIIYITKSPKARVIEVSVIPENADLTDSGLSNNTERSARYSIPSDGAEQSAAMDDYLAAKGKSAASPVPTKEVAPEAVVKEVTPLKPASGFLDGRDLRAEMGRSGPKTAATPASPTPVAPVRLPRPPASPGARPAGTSPPRPPHSTTSPAAPGTARPQRPAPRPPLPPRPGRPELEEKPLPRGPKVDRGDRWDSD